MPLDVGGLVRKKREERALSSKQALKKGREIATWDMGGEAPDGTGGKGLNQPVEEGEDECALKGSVKGCENKKKHRRKKKITKKEPGLVCTPENAERIGKGM